MSGSPRVEFLGDQQAAVFVPSVGGNGVPISEEEVLRVESDVRSGLSAVFNGATQVESVVGAYLNQDGSQRVTQEPLKRIYGLFKSADLNNEELRNRVRRVALEVASSLQQECVLVGWGPAHELVYGTSEQSTGGRRFSDLTPGKQRRFARASAAGLKAAKDVRAILSLDGWTIIPLPERDPQHRLAHKGQQQVLLVPRGEQPPPLGEGDLAIADDGPGPKDARPGILVWASTGGILRGPRRIPIVAGKVPRLTLELTLAMLGSKEVQPLIEVLDRESVTNAFYRRYRALGERIARALSSPTGTSPDAAREAQRLLGRLMFLRFLEQRGWLDDDRRYLEHLFERKGPRPYTDVLADLFRLLDTKKEKRSGEQKHSTVAYLNGGLFRLDRPVPLLPDDLFDPRMADSVLALFKHYEFTLDEGGSLSSAAEEAAVAVDPEMFGHVLESLREPGRRKAEGVVYTPREIAYALAFESIVSRLAATARLPRTRLVAFLRGAQGTTEELSSNIVQRILKRVADLRIVDPAVGSGSLLVAALEVLMQIVTRCKSALGANAVWVAVATPPSSSCFWKPATGRERASRL
jgi:hypothetical protein